MRGFPERTSAPCTSWRPIPRLGGPAVAAVPVPSPTVPAEPAVRRPAPAGYHEALAAHRAARPTKATTDSKVRAAAERQIRKQAREPEESFGDGRQALEEFRAKAAARQRAVTSSDAGWCWRSAA